MNRTRPSPAAPNEDPRARTREHILAAARSLFYERGGDKLSMRGIAARAGMPTMTLYGYFPTKTAIIRGLWTLALDPLFADMQAAEIRGATPAERLRAVALAYVDYWIGHPDRYRMVHMVEDKREGEPSWFIDETDVVPSHLRIAPLIAAARGTPDADCIVEAEAFICALTGIAHMAITVSEYRWAPPADYIDRILPAFTQQPVRSAKAAGR